MDSVGIPATNCYHTVTVSERGQLVIPLPVREKLGLRKGSQLILEFSPAEKTIVLRPAAAGGHKSLRGFLKRSRVLELLEAEHKQEIRRDARRFGR